MKVNYPELGGPGTQGKWYAEGEIFEHPSGAKYQRQGGKWVCIKKPGEEEPKRD